MGWELGLLCLGSHCSELSGTWPGAGRRGGTRGCKTIQQLPVSGSEELPGNSRQAVEVLRGFSNQ